MNINNKYIIGEIVLIKLTEKKGFVEEISIGHGGVVKYKVYWFAETSGTNLAWFYDYELEETHD